MKNINAAQLVPIFVVGMAILLALVVGNGVADENYTTVALSLGALAVIAMVALGSQFFILIPICWGLTGQISVLPLPFSVRQLVIILASAIFIQGAIFKTNKGSKTGREAIDIWIWVNVIYIITVFFRNPVGLNALGGDRVGGKPYVDVVLGVMTYLILRQQNISQNLAKKLPKWVLSVTIFTAFAGAVGYFLPSVGDHLAGFYSVFSSTGFIGISIEEITHGDGSERLGFLQEFGITLVLYVVSSCNPTQLLNINYIKISALYFAGIIEILASGYRSAVIQALLYTTLSVMVREKIVGLFKILLAIFFIASAAVAISYLPIKLPKTFQRAICFLPGNWEQEAVNDAQDTVDWRLGMWEMVLSSDRYIHQKVLGDGFGYLRDDLQRSIEITSGQSQLSGTEVRQEMFMLNGDFHSGPLSAIRFVGIVGLALFLPLNFLLAKMAWRLIKTSLGTEYEFCTLFFSIPAFISPLFSLFVFGDYRSDFIIVLFHVGMMKMLEASMVKYSPRITKLSS
jgi:hypothetical protein